MKKIALSLLLMSLAQFAVAQTTYTTSTSFACNQQVCNGVPLDQGGTWQFILANSAFSINSNGFYIFGNPGSYTGGIYNVSDHIPYTGAEGTLTFSWNAVLASNQSVHYSGSASVQGHQVRHCNNHGCWYTLVVDSATVTVQ